MTEAEQRGHYWAALLCAGIGLYLGYLVWSRQPGLRVPPGVGYLSAGAFLAAGAALVLQVRRARKGHLVSVFLLVAALAGIGGWIGFGPGGRQCKGSLGTLSFLPSELVCRTAFGAGAVLTGVIAVLILRSLLKDKNARLLAGPVLTFSAILPLHAQVQDESQAAAQIASLVARYDSGWNRKDTITVGRLLAPRYQYFTSRGGVSSRAETMGFLSAPDYVLGQAKRSELSVALSGPVAVVSSRWQGEGSYRGEAFKDDQRCGQTWVRTARAWQLLSEHCVQIATAPGPSN